MSENTNVGNVPQKPRKYSKLVIVLSCIAAALTVLLIVMILMIPKEEEEPAPTTTAPVVTETTAAPTTETTVPPETEPTMLPHLAELYEQNPDIAGWIRLEGTKMDYPVMYVPDDEEKYIRADFEGKYSLAGLPFIDKDCSLDPESDNLIIYGHNMENGTAFGALTYYGHEKFGLEHPIIHFSTLYEERSYEVVASFFDRVYYSYEDVFKFYQFIDVEDEEHFNEAITYFKDHSVYETGVTAEYGDNLLILVTCSYHHQYGRFVVVARMMTDEEIAEAAAEAAEATTVPAQ